MDLEAGGFGLKESPLLPQPLHLSLRRCERGLHGESPVKPGPKTGGQRRDFVPRSLAARGSARGGDDQFGSALDCNTGTDSAFDWADEDSAPPPGCSVARPRHAACSSCHGQTSIKPWSNIG